MSVASHSGTNIAVRLAILALSAVTMVWLFWHYPVITGVITLAILAALGVSARLARLIETDMPEMQGGKQSF